MRIVGGEFKGQRLVAPKSQLTRPTTEAHREMLFNVLAHRYSHQPVQVADFFAGTGALAWEALSHGAERALLVENSPEAIKCIRKNAETLRLSSERWSLCSQARVEQWGPLLARDFGAFAPFDTIFCDPPYGKGLVERLFKSLELAPLLIAPGALAVVEISRREETPKFPARWQLLDAREKGETRLLFVRA